ncbi:MAG TPA: P-loop NTPase fold protein, partial [Puia sp.]
LEATFIVNIPNTKAGQAFLKEFKEKEDAAAIEKRARMHVPSYVETFLESLHCQVHMLDFGNTTDPLVEGENWRPYRPTEEVIKTIDSIPLDDIVIVKNTVHVGHANLVESKIVWELKAIGKVIHHEKTGELGIHWFVRDLDIRIDMEDRPTRAVFYADPSLQRFVFSKINRSILDKLDVPRNRPDRFTIAGVHSDTDEGADHLDIGKDCRAFARVIAARSFTPPLAIALFGKWGSGKSFFMRTMQKEVSGLSDTNPMGGYCEGIVQIRFNAWSYLDANLWASIMTRIFEGLNEYIHTYSQATMVKKLGEDLNKQLNISKAEVSRLEGQKDSLAEQITSLQDRKDWLNEAIDSKIRTIEASTAWSIINKVNEQFNAEQRIKDALKENPTYVRTEEELKKIVPEKYWNDPSAAYAEAKSKFTFLHEFFRRDKIRNNVVWTGIIIMIIFVLPVLLDLFIQNLKSIDFTLSQVALSLLIAAGSLWRRAEQTYKILQPIAASFWKIKEEHEKKINEALAKFEQLEKALKLEIEKARSELVVVEQQLHENKSLQAQLEFKISNALSTEALYSFIEKRSASDDYKKYLGIISIIRKDFEILSYLFAGHQTELENSKEVRDLKEEFRKHFTRPLQRVILYIDDLDRCPEENVVQVLDAVNLLMAYPLFVVVVGVDPRWVKNALIMRHHAQFTGRVFGESAILNEIDIIEPARYLEKIFQIPFYLKAASSDSVQGMLEKLARTTAVDRPAPPLQSTIEVIPPDDLPEDDSPLQGPEIIDTEASQEETETEENYIKVLEISDEEIELIKSLSAIIGSNPRAIKRFINSYRIVKCHESFIYYSRRFQEDKLVAIIFLLALPIGEFRELARNFDAYISVYINGEDLFRHYLEYEEPNDSVIRLKKQLQLELSVTGGFKLLENLPLRLFIEQKDFINRFTFQFSWPG